MWPARPYWDNVLQGGAFPRVAAGLARSMPPRWAHASIPLTWSALDSSNSAEYFRQGDRAPRRGGQPPAPWPRGRPEDVQIIDLFHRRPGHGQAIGLGLDRLCQALPPLFRKFLGSSGPAMGRAPLRITAAATTGPARGHAPSSIPARGPAGWISSGTGAPPPPPGRQSPDW